MMWTKRSTPIRTLLPAYPSRKESQVNRRRARWLAYLLTVAALVVGALGFAGPAWADVPTSLTIAGPGLSAPIEVAQASEPDLFNRLLHQVNWVASATGGS